MFDRLTVTVLTFRLISNWFLCCCSTTSLFVVFIYFSLQKLHFQMKCSTAWKMMATGGSRPSSETPFFTLEITSRCIRLCMNAINNKGIQSLLDYKKRLTDTRLGVFNGELLPTLPLLLIRKLRFSCQTFQRCFIRMTTERRTLLQWV